MDHVELIDQFDGLQDADRHTMKTRATGKFYTHPFVTDHLIRAVVSELESFSQPEIRVTDPFCGDGRLVTSLLMKVRSLPHLAKCRWTVELWDVDSTAVKVAAESVLAVARSQDMDLHVRSHVGDSFEHARHHFGTFDVVVTNPPWEVLKPDRRELERLGDAANEYVNRLRIFDFSLRSLYPLSQPLTRFAGWGTNLARTGTELALRLLAPKGLCGVVSPASLLADAVSARLRKWLFTSHHISDIAYFPAEARLFQGADQQSVTFVARQNLPGPFDPVLTLYDSALGHTNITGLTITLQELESMEYALPFGFGVTAMKFTLRTRSFPCFQTLEGNGPEGLWAGRELDETGYEGFTALTGEYRFIKGRMVGRYQIVEQPGRFVLADQRVIPPSANYHRLVWRDVSRPSQKRRLQATIVPPNWVTGNSLNVAYFRDADMIRLKWLLAVVNSIPFEAQIRSSLATSHISLGAVRRTRIPQVPKAGDIAAIAALVDRCIGGDARAEIELEVAIAREYGLDRDGLDQLMSAFPKLKSDERTATRNCDAWRTVTGTK